MQADQTYWYPGLTTLPSITMTLLTSVSAVAWCVGCPQWIGLVANAEFFCNDVQNEPLAEQLRERVR
jgi:hypothetical protein